MPTVFIAGSIKIKRLDSRFVDRIETVVSEGLSVVLGDANGADTSIQQELSRLSAPDVTVFCTGSMPRNNVGSWPVERVQSTAASGTRAFFTAKDIRMAERADYGLMLWDAASTGTLSNVFELLSRNKSTVVFVNREKEFVNIKQNDDILKLVSMMSEGARQSAERKINLGKKVSAFMNVQNSMAF